MSFKILRSFATLPALAALGLGLAGAPAARADAVYTLALSGSYDHSPDCWETPDLCMSGPPSEQVGAWSGTLTVDIASGADGVYDVSTLGMELDANVGSFENGEGFFAPWGWVTVSGGRVSSIDATWFYAYTDVTMTFGGLDLSYDQPYQHHYGPTVASGAFLASAVPEPAAWLLVAGGLAALAARGRRGGDAKHRA
jgi:hypothetical protein